MDHGIPSDAPKPRLCHLRKRPDFAGYGFNLHAEKGKSGQFIGKVDEGSPAHLAGLREGDRIIEVNGTNVGSENHQQVVQRIKAVADETKFLVLDREADDYYRERKVVVRGDMHNVLLLETPAYHAGGSNGTDSKHRARLCHLKIWPEFTGYGFNLHAEKGKIVQYIGKVDKNSPAELAGLKEHDRIVEVNGTSVSGESHQDVVKRIKSDPKQVTMLVVDKESDAYFEKEGVAVSVHMHNIDRINCPDVQPFIDHDRHHNDVENGRDEHHHKEGSTSSNKDADDDDQHAVAAAAAVAAAVEGERDDSDNESRGSRDDDAKKVDGHNALAEEGHEHVEKEATAAGHDGGDHQAAEVREEHVSTAVKAAVVEAKAEEVVKKAEVEKKLEKKNDEANLDYEDIVDEITNIAESVEKEDAAKFEEEKKPDKAGLSLNVTAASTKVSTTSSSSMSPIESPKSPVVVGGIEFAGTAEEARRKMSKKRNVKETSMSLKAKYDLFQKL